MTAVLLTGVAAYASTNLDNLALLSLLFADRTTPARAVVLGEALGMAVLVGVSLSLALLARQAPGSLVSLLGLAPLGIGLSKLRGRNGLLVAPAKTEAGARPVSTLGVTALTVANGGDNIGVYAPLFAHEPGAVPFYAGLFMALTAVWCFAGFALVRNKVFGARLSVAGARALPFVLIGVGLWVLSGLFAEAG